MHITHTQTGKNSYQLVISKEDGPIIVTYHDFPNVFRETDLLMSELYGMLTRPGAPKTINGAFPEEGGVWLYDQLVPYIEGQILVDQYGGK